MAQCDYYRFKTCRSCTLIRYDYDEQLSIKTKRLEQLLSTLPQQSPKVASFVKSDLLLGSRNKGKLVASGTTKNPRLGISDSSQDTKEILNCPLHNPIINKIASSVKGLITEHGVRIYNIRKRDGELKFVLVRVLNGTGQVIVRLVLRSEEELPRIRKLAKDLAAKHSEIGIVTANIQPIPAAIIEGPKEISLVGPDDLTEVIGGYKYAVSSQSFSQVTGNVAEKLYKNVAEKVAQYNPNYMLDLFCGSGYFSIFCHSGAKKLLGVEISEAAIKDATKSTELNSIGNVEFQSADVLGFLKGQIDKPDLILVNPPRRGLKEEVCNEISRLGPKVLIYSSCNPETLVQDLSVLTNYRTVSIEPFDMFPLTDHFETVVVLERS